MQFFKFWLMSYFNHFCYLGPFVAHDLGKADALYHFFHSFIQFLAFLYLFIDISFVIGNWIFDLFHNILKLVSLSKLEDFLLRAILQNFHKNMSLISLFLWRNDVFRWPFIDLQLYFWIDVAILSFLLWFPESDDVICISFDIVNVLNQSLLFLAHHLLQITWKDANFHAEL
jgi:hypothetical protein